MIPVSVSSLFRDLVMSDGLSMSSLTFPFFLNKSHCLYKLLNQMRMNFRLTSTSKGLNGSFVSNE